MRSRATLLLVPPLALALACGSSSTCSLSRAAGTPSACANPIGASAAAGQLQVAAHATLTVGEQLHFDVPPGTASLTVVEQALSAPEKVTYGDGTFDNSAVPLQLVDPAGVVVHDETVRSPSSDPLALPQRMAYFGATAPATGTLTIPNTTAGLALLGSQGLTPGTWTVTASDDAFLCARQCCTGGSTGSRYDVTVVLRSTVDGQIPATGNLDVTVWFATSLTSVAGKPLSAAAASAGTDPDLKRMESTLRTVLGHAGVVVRSVTYQDLFASLPDALAAAASDPGGIDTDQSGPCSDLSRLFAYSADGNRLNVFFVAALASKTLAAGQQVVGVDGTVPGPATMVGSSASGVAVSTFDIRLGSGTSTCASSTPTLGGIHPCGADVTAYVIAHEAGHYLGLYHTTEEQGTAFDPLLDTPSCACSACRPSSATTQCSATGAAQGSGYLMTAADCSRGTTTCGGADNLMFWLLASTAQGTLTPEQGRVIRANPLVQ